MLWSFSRDGGVPGYTLWSSVNKYTGTPINAGEYRMSSELLLEASNIHSSHSLEFFDLSCLDKW